MTVLGNKVLGRGPRNATVMFIGEAPGSQEEAWKKPFVGKTGQEMERYLKQAGIVMRDCYLTNVCKYRPTTRSRTGNVAPSAEDIKRDEPELVAEIESVKPEWVVAVGRFAARWLLGDVDIESSHGFAYPTKNYRAGKRGHEFTTVVVTHPAAGLHQVEVQPIVYWDFQQLGKYVSGKLTPTTPVDEYPDPDYYEPRGNVTLIESLPVAIDTEGLKGRVWGLSYSQTPGCAGVVRATNKKALKSLKELLLNG